MSAEVYTAKNLSESLAPGVIGFFAFEGRTGGPKDGVFHISNSMNFNVLAVSGLAVTEGSLGNTHIGDAVFEVLSMNWAKDGSVAAVIGTWHRDDFNRDGTRRPYARDMKFVVTLSYLTA